MPLLPAWLLAQHPQHPSAPCPAGIAVRASFSTSTAGALLASGIADALSAGVLLFVCLVDLLQPMMTDSEWLRSQHWVMQVGALRGGHPVGLMV